MNEWGLSATKVWWNLESPPLLINLNNGVAWGKIAEIVENYLQKGNKVAIDGKLVHRVYDDSGGQKKYITEVVANSVMMLDSKPKG